MLTLGVSAGPEWLVSWLIAGSCKTILFSELSSSGSGKVC